MENISQALVRLGMMDITTTVGHSLTDQSLVSYSAIDGTQLGTVGMVSPDAIGPMVERSQAAFDAWMGVQHLRFGPSEVDGRSLSIAFWPDPKGSGARARAQASRSAGASRRRRYTWARAATIRMATSRNALCWPSCGSILRARLTHRSRSSFCRAITALTARAAR